MNWTLIIAALIVHLVFFYSIFDIYFTSPLVHGMSPRIIPLSPPAKRLILFVADGLRADKMYSIKESGISHAPFIRNIIEKSGAWGVSHTRVPTESRPGHVALIAGFYEDVSAVAKGWKENPVEFDSAFNESRYTWSWGSPDILPMFAKGASGDHVFTYMYPAESEDFAGADSSKLDTWVFDSVTDFLANAKTNTTMYEMLHENKIILFLHLLGIDTNGHSHKPYSKEYLSNIEVVDKGIQQLVNKIEEFYENDGKTSYILSSDHGMTDWGSHGAGDPSETLTPLIAWGAGIRKPEKAPVHQSDSPNDWKLNHLRRSDVLQADISPLMTSLIGIPFPMNSVGTVPLEFLNNSDHYKAEALLCNALQILEQFDIKMKQKKDTTLSLLFVPFKSLDGDRRNELVAIIRQFISENKYDSAISKIQELINLSLTGLNYYHNYDRFFLGTSIVLGFLGWISYVIVLILQKHTLLTLPAGPDRLMKNSHGLPFWHSAKGIRILFTLLAVFISSLLYVQSLPLTHYVYTLLPVFLWHKVIQQRSCLWIVWWYIRDHGYIWYSVSYLLLGLAGLEIIVLTFFSRNLLSIGIALLSAWPFMSDTMKENKLYLWGWSTSCLLLAIFPLLPPVGRDANYTYVMIAGVFGILLILMTSKQLYKQSTISYVQICILGFSIYFVWTTSNSISQKEGLPYFNQFGAWTILISSAVVPLLESTNMYLRLLTVALSFFPTYLLLSTSHEGFFVIVLCALLFFWLQLEALSAHKKFEKLEQLDFGHSVGILESHRKLRLSDLRIAYFFIFLLMTAFYGTGNIASVNSFDPSTVYCFLTVFNPFVMGALLLLKIIIPFVLVSCTFNAIHIVLNVPTQSLFLLVMLMSDYMALHFFFLVRDEGSWLDIGTSISHYVMVMCLNLFVLVILAFSHIFTNFSVLSNYKKHYM